MIKSVFYKINECRICRSKDLKKIIDLKSQYIQGSFIKKNFPKPYLKKIPLQLVLCSRCTLVQLLHTTKKEILYKKDDVYDAFELIKDLEYWHNIADHQGTEIEVTFKTPKED